MSATNADGFDDNADASPTTHATPSDAVNIDFLTFKLERLFDLIDTDRNGAIEKKDFTMKAKKQIENLKAKGKEISPETEKKLVEAYGTFFNRYSFRGMVGGASKASFVRYMKVLGRIPGFAAVSKWLNRPIYVASDLNGNGTLDLEEFCCMWSPYGHTDEEMKEIFIIIDEDGNGKLTVDELAYAVARYLQDKEDSKYSNIFGVINRFAKKGSK